MLPAEEEEKARYLQHHNQIEDQAYVEFLNTAIQPALTFLIPDMQCLDYGCGAVPVLSQLLLRDYQIHCANYDPYFYPVLADKNYDFIFSTETFEHFFQPEKELQQLRKLMRTGAYLCIMTNHYQYLADFEDWWYRRDITHVCFYHTKTFQYIAATFGFRLLYHDQAHIVIFQKT